MPTIPHFPPALWRGITFDWLWVYRGATPHSLQWSQEIIVPPGVFFVEKGRVKIRANEKEIDVRPGHAFFSAPGSRQQWFAEDTHLLSVGFRCQWPDGLPLYSVGLNITLPGSRVKRLLEVTETLFTEVHWRKKEVSYREGTAEINRTLQAWSRHEAAFRLWFAEYTAVLEKNHIHPTPRTRAEDRRSQHLRQWLQDWPLDRALDLNEVASELSLTPRRIHQLLKDELGTTAQAYLDRRRLENARQRLLQEDVPLKEMAFALGFKHPPHFTAWFRRHTGMTPTAYRLGQGQEGA